MPGNRGPRKSAVATNEKLAAAYSAVFESPDGRIVLADLLARAGMLEVSTVFGDPYATHFRDGRRALALEIVNLLRWSEMELLQLAKERTAETLALGQRAEATDQEEPYVPFN